MIHPIYYSLELIEIGLCVVLTALVFTIAIISTVKLLSKRR